jgi:hypothetical protein
MGSSAKRRATPGCDQDSNELYSRMEWLGSYQLVTSREQLWKRRLRQPFPAPAKRVPASQDLTRPWDTTLRDPSHSRVDPKDKQWTNQAPRACRWARVEAFPDYDLQLQMPRTKDPALDHRFGEGPGKIELTPTKPCPPQQELAWSQPAGRRRAMP